MPALWTMMSTQFTNEQLTHIHFIYIFCDKHIQTAAENRVAFSSIFQQLQATAAFTNTREHAI
jgi:hypothetical protein